MKIPELLLKLSKKYGLMLSLVGVLIIGLLLKPEFILSLLEKDKGLWFLGFLLILILVLFFMSRGEYSVQKSVQNDSIIRDLLKNSFESFIQNNVSFQKQVNEVLNEILDLIDSLNTSFDSFKERIIEIDKQLYDINNKIAGDIPFSVLKTIIKDATLLIIYEICQDLNSLNNMAELNSYIDTFKFKFQNNYISTISFKYLSHVNKDTKDYIITILQTLLSRIYNYLSANKEQILKQLQSKDRVIIKNQLVNILYQVISQSKIDSSVLDNSTMGVDNNE